jgi:eukaryotic-like serine/threonine-protein kinase
MLVGKELGPYVVDKELGSGAMGTVYRAKHKTSGERVAIKLMSPALGTSEAALARFVREVAILKQLDHPNIVRYKGSGRYHKNPFYIMEYVDGESLDQILNRRKRIAWEELIDLGTHLCAALQHAHEKGIIHRDLKPSNLMILKDGTVKLTDFGIAKDTDVTALTAANSTVGTAAYMSPEQCRGVRDISHKTDLYSMGIMFYELLTGRKPFVGETPMEVFLLHANKTDFKRPQEILLDLPIWLDTLVMQLLEKDPNKRPLNAKAVADSLRLIKEKVETQRSAGVEIATKRRIDRTSSDKKLDDQDKEIARTMLGKKKKKKEPAFYTKGWFTITMLTLLAGLMLTCVYFIFLRVESADTLYAQAETLMGSPSEASRKEARDGPLALFLRHYPSHEKIGQIQKWADQYDFETLDRQMHNRRASALKFTPGPEEEEFRKALDEEDQGKLGAAAMRWHALSKKKGNADPDLHAWGLLGERYLKALEDVETLNTQLLKRKDEKGTGDFEPIALAAVRAGLLRDEALGELVRARADNDEAREKSAQDEAARRLIEARSKWNDLKSAASGNQPEHRRWFLLAGHRLHELRDAK